MSVSKSAAARIGYINLYRALTGGSSQAKFCELFVQQHEIGSQNYTGIILTFIVSIRSSTLSWISMENAAGYDFCLFVLGIIPAEFSSSCIA